MTETLTPYGGRMLDIAKNEWLKKAETCPGRMVGLSDLPILCFTGRKCQTAENQYAGFKTCFGRHWSGYDKRVG